MTAGWQPISTAPNDGTVVEVGWRFAQPGKPPAASAAAGWDGSRWVAVNGEMAIHLPGPNVWRPLGGGS